MPVLRAEERLEALQRLPCARFFVRGPIVAQRPANQRAPGEREHADGRHHRQEQPGSDRVSHAIVLQCCPGPAQVKAPPGARNPALCSLARCQTLWLKGVHRTMLAFLDVHYTEPTARAACVLAHGWADAGACGQHTVEVSPISPYEPGKFYRRELPCLLAVLRLAPALEVVIIDGYVWLDEHHAPGLGAHLFEALERQVPVVGIAKTAFKGSPMAERVLRPSSKKPLFITSIGLPQPEAARLVSTMHGAARLPTLVRLADAHARATRG
jgi:deoxyribonuclease V